MKRNSKDKLSSAVVVILLFGVISMLGDVVYETARSANSQYLNLLQISAAQVGIVFGIGEFLGYFLRLITGIATDKSGKQWTFIFLGYGLLVVVPLMGYTMKWPILVILILMERIGKALRSPAKDTILSGVAENQVGIGIAFGLQEALDQIGAFIGPIIFTAVFYFTGKSDIEQYQQGYKLLFIPFILLMVVLYLAYQKIQKEGLIAKESNQETSQEQLRPILWLYTAFTFFCTLGFVNFSTIGYHLKANHLMADGTITLVYSIAMVVDAIAALSVGKAYDHLKTKTENKTGGIFVLMGIPFLTILLPLLTLSKSPGLVIVGMVLFGIVIGTHETIMRSAIADITPYKKRSTGYGIFNAFYGLALFGGATIMGWFYDKAQISGIILFTFVVEIIAIILFYQLYRKIRLQRNSL